MAKTKGKLALGGLFLAGVGYLAGILTAPKSGKETRKDIKDTAVKAKTEAEKQLKQLHAELGDLVEKGKTQAGKLTATAKKDAHKAVEFGQQARDKAKQVLSALHEGESDDKDLQKAIDEAGKAVSNLKKYVSKNAKSKKKPKAAPDAKDYEQLGKMLTEIYETGYLDHGKSYKMSFLKGVLGGLGGVIGATIVVALLIWILSFFKTLPGIKPLYDNLQRPSSSQSE